MTEVPLSKAPIPQLLPGRRNMAAHCSGRVFTGCVCSLLCVCPLDGLNAEHEFRVWVTILGRMSLSLHITFFTSINTMPTRWMYYAHNFSTYWENVKSDDPCYQHDLRMLQRASCASKNRGSFARSFSWVFTFHRKCTWAQLYRNSLIRSQTQNNNTRTLF